MLQKYFAHRDSKTNHDFNACLMRQIFHVTNLGDGQTGSIGRETMLKRHRDLEIEVAEALHRKEMSFSDKKIFETVGGKAIWVSFYENMVMFTDVDTE